MSRAPIGRRAAWRPIGHVDAGRLGAVLAVLWAAHDLADHVVQTDRQAAGKATSWRAMAGHVGGYHAVQVAALLVLRRLAGVRPSLARTAVAVGVSAGTHAVLDRRWPVVRTLELTGSPRFARSSTVRVHHSVDGYGRAHTNGIPKTVDAVGPLPLHGPYLADQALHHAVLAVCAVILAGGRS